MPSTGYPLRTMAQIASDRRATVLFTAFEPSGDAHAAPVIAALAQRDPSVRIAAWGGPRMRAAGAEMLGITAEDGAMGLAGIAKIGLVRRVRAAAVAWSRENAVTVHVPVDSPAANFPVVRALRPLGVKTVHLVAPQLWAWGGWRIRKLRRRTDLVLCLLPFEQEWFRSRGVPAAFIGHPVMERQLDAARLDADALRLPSGSPRIAMLPGSRSQELHANLRSLVETFARLRQSHGKAVCVLVAANENLRQLAQQMVPAMPSGMHVQVGGLDAVLHWCDLALNVSGTVSLDVALHAKPMVGVYRISAPSLAVSRLLLRSPVRLLPNIIAGRKIVPEFVPTTAGPEAFAAAADSLIRDSHAADEARAALRLVAQLFVGHDSGFEAAALIDHVCRGGSTAAMVLDSVVSAARPSQATAHGKASP